MMERFYHVTAQTNRGCYSATCGLPKPQAPTATIEAVNMGKRICRMETAVWPKRRARPNGQVKIAAVRAGGGVSSPATVTRFLTVTTG